MMLLLFLFMGYLKDEAYKMNPSQNETVFEKILAVTCQELHVNLCLMREGACVHVCARTHKHMHAHAQPDTSYSASYNLSK
jgi:hypothetical protein